MMVAGADSTLHMVLCTHARLLHHDADRIVDLNSQFPITLRGIPLVPKMLLVVKLKLVRGGSEAMKLPNVSQG